MGRRASASRASRPKIVSPSRGRVGAREQHLDERCFARAVGAEQSKRAALLDTQRDAVNGPNVLAGPATPEDFDEAVGFDGERHG